MLFTYMKKSSSNDFRQYDTDADKELLSVRNHYKEMRKKQTLSYVKRMKELWGRSFQNRSIAENELRSMTIREAFEKLDEFVDKSDPDTELPNIQHMFQTAEAIRADNLPDWFQLVGLIHDLGKIMSLWGVDENGQSCDKQWGVCGDTWILGYNGYKHTVFPEYEPYDKSDLEYKEKCGMDNLICTWGHDEYLYNILRRHSYLPEVALKVIRYHSLYPWHKDGAYMEFCTETDLKVLDWVKLFNNYDLYTKHDKTIVPDDLWPYYNDIIAKYIPGNIDW